MASLTFSKNLMEKTLLESDCFVMKHSVGIARLKLQLSCSILFNSLDPPLVTILKKSPKLILAVGLGEPI